MYVEMWHVLTGMFADVGEQPIALYFEPEILRHLSRRANEASDFLGARVCAEIGERYVFSFRNNQYVRRSERVNIMKRESPLVFIDLPAWEFAAKDPGKNIALVVWRLAAHSHGW